MAYAAEDVLKTINARKRRLAQDLAQATVDGDTAREDELKAHAAQLREWQAECESGDESRADAAGEAVVAGQPEFRQLCPKAAPASEPGPDQGLSGVGIEKPGE